MKTTSWSLNFLVVLVLGTRGLACSDGAGDGVGDTGGSASATGGSMTGGAASGGQASGGSSSSSGGSGGTNAGGSGGGSGGSEVVVGCPSGDVPPAGDCTEWSNANVAERCDYGETQCFCQTGQQGATWMCAVCPTTVAAGDECSVTEMSCGECVCEMAFVQGGQREWSFVCGS